MPQDRNDATSTRDKNLARTAERATEVESGAWKTRSVTSATASTRAQRAARSQLNYVPLFTAALGAAMGYLLGRALEGSTIRQGRPHRSHDDALTILNHLIQISRDGERGFRECEEGVQSEELKRVFSRAAERCEEAVAQLSREVRALGGDPAKGATLSGSLHRRWVDLKSAITGMDDAAILAECERGEDVAKEAYRRALKSDLPLRLRPLIERQYHGVVANHDQVRTLRNSYRSRAE